MRALCVRESVSESVCGIERVSMSVCVHGGGRTYTPANSHACTLHAHAHMHMH
jgi:hypothetical protein